MAMSRTTTSASSDPKRELSFRLSKKVAELTQVVHMLFVRNHEKEVQLERLRVEHEHQIAELRAALEKEVIVGKRACANSNNAAQKEAENAARLADVEGLLAAERDECQQTRDMLMNERRDMERLKEAHARDVTKINERLEASQRDCERKHAELVQQKRALSELGAAADARLREAEAAMKRVLKDSDHLRAQLESAETVRQQVSLRNQQIDAELRDLRRQVLRSTPNNVKSSAQSARAEENVNAKNKPNEELIKLRNLVQRYRMELSNREYNFNRMFREKQPIIVNRPDSRASMGCSPLEMKSARDKSGKSLNGNAELRDLADMSYDAADAVSVAVTTGKMLPQLTSFGRQRMSRNSKPQRQIVSANHAGQA